MVPVRSVPEFWVDCCSLPQGGALRAQADLVGRLGNGVREEGLQPSLVTTPTAATDLSSVDQLPSLLRGPASSVSLPNPASQTFVTCRPPARMLSYPHVQLFI